MDIVNYLIGTVLGLGGMILALKFIDKSEKKGGSWSGGLAVIIIILLCLLIYRA